MVREIIFGVCDKTGECDSYFGFFKNEDDAIKEVKIQGHNLKEDLGIFDITIKKDRVISNSDNKLLIVIHNFVLR